MTSGNNSCIASMRLVLVIFTVIAAFIITRYIVPVRVPGTMVHPIKYKIITGTFALMLDLVSDMKSFSNGSKSFFFRHSLLKQSLVFLIIKYLILQSIFVVELNYVRLIMVKYW